MLLKTNISNLNTAAARKDGFTFCIDMINVETERRLKASCLTEDVCTII